MKLEYALIAVVVLAAGCGGQGMDQSAGTKAGAAEDAAYAEDVRRGLQLTGAIVASAFEIDDGKYTVCSKGLHNDHGGGITGVHFESGDTITIDHDAGPIQSEVKFASDSNHETLDLTLDMVKVFSGDYLVGLVESAPTRHDKGGSPYDIEHAFVISRELKSVPGCGLSGKNVIRIVTCWRADTTSRFVCADPGGDYGHVHADQ